MIVHFLSFFPARINGYTSGSPTDAQGPGCQDWAIIEPPADYRNRLPPSLARPQGNIS
ncbi:MULTISPECIES: hypothetical protein [unclassified Pseudomonas]|uniref:hypothetical protein n=1 Tax=unclassified Pseudomonas TaxID=196821 RepID=UPI002A36A85B|nr:MULTISPECIES: hypothetical protein [unclassified Pseudomonas]MDX9673259.1 hypothetical protein [Pseudomonas sp. P8_250]WPN38200.1 hypothetical protein QMK53_11295 [Pseudomonas sp. P8_139]WPN39997.1 hypothetical protein QMK55_20080 [Pseudomonas sp. P8_229]